jgi:3'-phosphoadenosine 5'-phosphosulfate sulfotransferase (PAPS reductase)/FAD synthetase
VVNPLDYDHVVVAFSGGKDSTAAFLHLLDRNAPKDRIELWHHDIDGREGSHLMDWPSTPAYCGAFARAFDVPLYFSWRIGGFEREMLRDSTPTAPIQWENPDGSLGKAGGKGPPGTRLKFPQVSVDLCLRWCSPYLKIDVGSIAVRNQPRFLGKNTLFISGERAEESPCRARYKEFEVDRTNSDRRTVHRWRPIHRWREQQVWEILRRDRVNPVRDQLRIVTNRAHGRGTDFHLRSVTNRLHRGPPYKRGQLRFAIVARHAALLMKHPVTRTTLYSTDSRRTRFGFWRIGSRTCSICYMIAIVCSRQGGGM